MAEIFEHGYASVYGLQHKRHDDYDELESPRDFCSRPTFSFQVLSKPVLHVFDDRRTHNFVCKKRQKSFCDSRKHVHFTSETSAHITRFNDWMA